MNWYVVYRGRSPGVYNSWRSCQEQVTGFSNNSYEGFETLQESQANYMNYLNNNELGAHEVIEHQLIAQVVENHVIPDVGNQVVGSRMKDFIIIVLLVVIVKLLLF